MTSDTVAALLESRRGFVIAAAGCGKTEAIAQAVEAGPSKRQLILTHTHAGVKALRDRLAKYGISETRFRVETIAGWSLRYGISYPSLSGLRESKPTGGEWSETYSAAAEVLRSETVRQVIAESYACLYVDEYQDCTKRQHDLIRSVADVIPCRVLGDPLQGIFAFREPLVDWNADVRRTFDELPSLVTPWRWQDNPRLGSCLTKLRDALLNGYEFDLRRPPIRWKPLPRSDEERVIVQRKVCFENAAHDGSIVAIRRWPSECHHVASGLNGSFTVMEEMDCSDLLRAAARLETATGIARSTELINFAESCMIGIATPLRTIRQSLRAGQLPDPRRLRKVRDVAAAMCAVASTQDFEPVQEALETIDHVPGARSIAVNSGRKCDDRSGYAPPALDLH